MNSIYFCVYILNFLYLVWSCDKDILLWISLDGLSHDYFTARNAPFMFDLSRKGMYSVDGMGTVYITATFPNHFSLVTGLYSETHGIVSNRFKVDNQTFKKDSEEEFWWNPNNTTIPIWIANEMGDNQKSAVLHWVGSISTYNGRRPSFSLGKYKTEEPSTMFNMAYDKIASCEYNLILTYIYKIDSIGHSFGISGDEYPAIIREVDLLFETFMRRLKQNNLDERLSIIVTSDHGMQNMDASKIHYITDYTDQNFESIYDGVAVLVTTHGNNTAAAKIVNDLNSVENKKWTAYLKGNVPEEYHYTHSERIPEIVVMVDDNWCLYGDRGQSVNNCGIMGQHGYPYENSDSMKAIFFAVGKKFPQKVPQTNIKSVDVYPFVCRILEVESYCNPCNGSYSVFSFPKETWVLGYILIAISLAVVLAVTIGLVVHTLRKNKVSATKRNQILSQASLISSSQDV